MTHARETLVVEDLHKSFGALEVLKGISMTAHEHDVVSILGSSGSRKSTLLRCINLLEIPNAGDVTVQGELIRMRRVPSREPVPEDHRQVERIRAMLGMVFQQFNLWSHMTVLQNVVEAPRHVRGLPNAQATERAEAVLVSRHACYVAFVLITFSSSHDGEEVGMKRYVVALEKEERDELAGITRKGSHQSQKVINALILLNCDEGEFNEHRARGEAVAEILRISARKVDRVKKRFVEEGMEAALGGRQGRRPSYVRKADGEFEARLVALSCAEPPEGHSQWSLRLLADRVVELGHIDSVSHETVRRVLKKTQSSRGGASAG